MCSSILENLKSSLVTSISCSSYHPSHNLSKYVIIQLLFSQVLLPESFQNSKVFLHSSHLAFSRCILWPSRWCIHIVVLTVTASLKPIYFIREIFPYDHKPVDSNTYLQYIYVDKAFSWWDVVAEVWELFTYFKGLSLTVEFLFFLGF